MSVLMSLVLKLNPNVDELLSCLSLLLQAPPLLLMNSVTLGLLMCYKTFDPGLLTSDLLTTVFFSLKDGLTHNRAYV